MNLSKKRYLWIYRRKNILISRGSELRCFQLLQYEYQLFNSALTSSNVYYHPKQCLKALPYAIGTVVFLTLAFALWVHSLPTPPIPVDPLADMPIPGEGNGMTFEEALAAQTDPARKEGMQNLFRDINAEVKAAGNGEEEEPENVMNLDGEEL